MAVYGKWIEQLLLDDLGAATIKAMLVEAAYDQNQATEFRSSVTVNEASGTGYTAGGVTVTGVDFTYDPDGELVMTCDPVEFGTISSLDIAGIIFYKVNGSSATDRLLVADMFGAADVDALVTFTYSPDPGGLVVATF